MGGGVKIFLSHVPCSLLCFCFHTICSLSWSLTVWKSMFLCLCFFLKASLSSKMRSYGLPLCGRKQTGLWYLVVHPLLYNLWGQMKKASLKSFQDFVCESESWFSVYQCTWKDFMGKKEIWKYTIQIQKE